MYNYYIGIKKVLKGLLMKQASLYYLFEYYLKSIAIIK